MPAEGDHCYNLVTTTAEEALAVVGLKPVAMPQLKAPFEPVQCAQFERLVAQERNRHIGEFKPAFVRAASGASDELLLFLRRFLQGPGDRRDVEDRRLLDRHGIRRRLARLARLRPHRERSCGCAAEKRGQEFSSFDVACHVTPPVGGHSCNGGSYHASIARSVTKAV